MSGEIILHEPVVEIITAAEWAAGKFRAVWNAATAAIDDGLAGELTWTPQKNTRSLQANACMWAHLQDLSRQVVWHGSKLTPEEWKEVMSAGLKQQRAVPGIDGGFVVLGARTSRMSIKEMGALIELIRAFGANKNVRFTAPAWMEE